MICNNVNVNKVQVFFCVWGFYPHGVASKFRISYFETLKHTRGT